MATDSTRSFVDELILRPFIPKRDDEFLRRLYAESRSDVRGIFPDENEQRRFLDLQYRGQSLSYAREFPGAAHSILELDGHPIGRIMIDRQPTHTQLVDISLLEEYRNRGIGTHLLESLVRECQLSGLPCELTVLQSNKARRLYERLGFHVTGDDGVRLRMSWNGRPGTDRPIRE